MQAIVFDDGGGELAPLTDLRPAFDVRVGGLTNLARLSERLGLSVQGLHVPVPLRELVRDQHDIPVNAIPAGDEEPVLLINGRCPIPPGEVAGLEPAQTLIESESGDLIAALLDRRAAAAALDSLGDPASIDAKRITIGQRVLLARPWHARSVRDDAIAIDLEILLADPSHAAITRAGPPPGVHVVGDHPVHLAPDAQILPGVVLDAEDGPIVIRRGATVRPGAVISGPAIIGRRSTVLDRATIGPDTAIGPVCKVGGEVGGTVFQGHANKAHDGYLGDAWVGQWANLGAGTTVSNLLNTYAEVIAQATPAGPRERTGETFLGPIIGDHVKTAIGTRIMTGAVLHTGCMFARTSPVAGCVGRFTWSTDAGDRRYRIAKFIEVVRTVLGRRDIEPSEAYLKRLEALAASTPA